MLDLALHNEAINQAHQTLQMNSANARKKYTL